MSAPQRAFITRSYTRTRAKGKTKALVCLLAIFLGLWPRSISSAVGTLAPSPWLTVFNAAGQVVSGACIWTYTAGTTTAIATYTDVGLTVANPNPIIAGSDGRFVAYLSPGTSYKFTYEQACTPPAHGTLIRTQDNIAAVPTSASNADVLGTAGVNLTAGQVVFLSDGSGGNTAGQWYVASNANAYSSTTVQVGIAIAAITSGQVGTIRLGGEVTGLSALTVGALYYIGTAGALTSTAPAVNSRLIGQADSATTLVITPTPAAAPVIDNGVDDFRLSLSTATCVPGADVTGATTLYLTPCSGNRIVLLDGSGVPTLYTTAEISLAVPATTNTMYDAWVYANAGAPTLEFLAWTNDTTRATAIARSNGIWTKSGDTTRRFVGSFRTTAVSGQTEDSAVKRYVWNMYNRVTRTLLRFDSTASWSASGTIFRQANGSTANQIDLVIGLAEDALLLSGAMTWTTNANGINASAGIGEDSTTTPLTQAAVSIGTGQVAPDHNVLVIPASSRLPAIGRHFYALLEGTGSPANVTFYGSVVSTGAGTSTQAIISALWRN